MKKEELYFSPRFKFRDLDWDNKDTLIEAFEDRVKGFYLKPARLLNDSRLAFACGVLCATAIDFIAKFAVGERSSHKRSVKWLSKNIIEFNRDRLADRFYEEFRNGLVHEGRIKEFGSFSYETQETVIMDDDAITINPRILADKLTGAFDSYLKELRADKKSHMRFRNNLAKTFGSEAILSKFLY